MQSAYDKKATWQGWLFLVFFREIIQVVNFVQDLSQLLAGHFQPAQLQVFLGLRLAV